MCSNWNNVAGFFSFFFGFLFFSPFYSPFVRSTSFLFFVFLLFCLWPRPLITVAVLGKIQVFFWFLALVRKGKNFFTSGFIRLKKFQAIIILGEMMRSLFFGMFVWWFNDFDYQTETKSSKKNHFIQSHYCLFRLSCVWQ